MARSIAAFGNGQGPSEGQDLRLTGRGDLLVVTDLEDVRQRVIEALRFEQGEWYLAVSKGVPYRSEVFTRPVSAGLAKAVIADRVRRVEGVTRILELSASINADTRRFTCFVRAETPFGAVEVFNG